jgi:hypothetical protein
MVAVEPQTQIARSQRQASCVVQGEAVVMSLVNEEFYALNPTASAVWHLTEVPGPVEAIVDDLVDRYAVDRATCERDVCAVLDRLVQRGIVEVTEPTAVDITDATETSGASVGAAGTGVTGVEHS